MLIGLINVKPRSAHSKYLNSGFLTGAIIPDLDFIPLILTYLFNRDLAISFHRTFSHSIFTAMCVGFLGLFFFQSKRHIFYFLITCAVGIGIHSLLDILMWFAPVKLFWPFQSEITVWDNFIIPDIYWNLIASLEVICYCLYIEVLIHLKKIKYNWEIIVLLAFHIVITILFVLLGFNLSKVQFEALAYGTAIIVGFIPSIYLSMKYFNR